LRRWLRHIRPAQDSEHARKHGKGSKVLHGKKDELAHNRKPARP
jgi:hypothetical protein